MVDIYNSSIRIVLGWPEIPPRGKLVDIPPEPKKSDHVSDTIKSDNPVKSYTDYDKLKIFIEGFATVLWHGVDELTPTHYHTTHDKEIIKNFAAMNNDLSLLLVSLKSGNLTRDEFISVVETCNKIITDAETFNNRIITEVLNSNDYTIYRFTQDHSINRNNVPDFKLPGCNVPTMKKSLSNAIDEGFKKIHKEWVKQSTTNNNPDSQ